MFAPSPTRQSQFKPHRPSLPQHHPIHNKAEVSNSAIWRELRHVSRVAKARTCNHPLTLRTTQHEGLCCSEPAGPCEEGRAVATGLRAPLRVGRLQTVFPTSRAPGCCLGDSSAVSSSLLAHSDEITLCCGFCFVIYLKCWLFTHFEFTQFSVAH